MRLFSKFLQTSYKPSPTELSMSYFFFFSLFFFKFYFIFKLYNIVLVLPNIEMNPPQVLTHSDYQKLQPHTNPLGPHSSLFLSHPHDTLVPQEAVTEDLPSVLILN